MLGHPPESMHFKDQFDMQHMIVYIVKFSAIFNFRMCNMAYAPCTYYLVNAQELNTASLNTNDRSIEYWKYL